MPRRGVTLGDKEALSGLAASWDKSKAIRGHLLKTGNLLRWPSPAQVGCINFETLGLNYRVMTKLLRIWLPKIDTLKTVNIFACRQEIAQLRSDLSLPADQVKIACDASSVRGFMSYMTKRHDGSIRRDPQVAKLFDVIGEYFEVVQVQHGQGLESGSSSESLVKSEGPDDEELDDEELAVALGAPKRELASDLGAGSSVESLHTGLTNELHKVSLDESPPPEIIRVSAPKAVSPSVLLDKRNKIEALKREIEIKKRSINCARPWKRAKPDEPEDTQVVDLFPVAKNLKAEFDAVDDKGPVSANEVASASQQPPALEDSAESQGSDDLFHAEPQEFLTRESQFADRKQAEEPGDDFDLPEPTKPKAKAKAKSKAKAKAKAKGKAKAKAASKSKASPGKPRGRPRKDKAKPAVHADLKSEAADGEADDPEDELKSQADGEVRKSAAPNPIFARRYRPGFCVFAGKRWDAIKASFELIIANRVKTPSTVQALFWTHCVSCLGEAGLQKGARPQAKDNTWDVAKLRKVCDNAAYSFLTLESTQSP
ncbi:CRYD [Symbiodinium necroappetens]|uniref:CRYD protein n=1 Tax=Symbiodinium necroappetens TaxID=1628268 RepID=A0A812NTX1_9DINO|nr:CRYD [Symbiodinium necroappetens]